MNKWLDPNLTLGERCVAFAENEMANKVMEDTPNSFTSARIREYFKICTRIINGKEFPIGATFTKGNWCSAGASYCLHKSLLPGEAPVHGYRLGVVEVVADMQKLGTYRDIKDVKAGNYQIKVGDVIFFDRSNPSDPSTAWRRHIGRVLDVGNSQEFVCISGNSNGRWRVTNHKYTQPTLLGFGEYPTATTQATPDPNVKIDWDHVDIDTLAPMIDTGDQLDIDDVWDLFRKIK